MDHVAAKPSRQATACNWCRVHKMKCDTQQPACRNCQKRGIECVTNDLRRPERIGRRVEPKGRRANRASQPTPSSIAQASQNGECDASLCQPPSFSPSPPPSPTRRLLASIDRDSAIPSIFTVPFENGDQRHSQHGRVPDSSESTDVNTTANSSKNPTSTSGYGPTDSDILIVTDKSQSRHQVVGSANSIYVMAQWLDLFFAKRDYWRPIYPYFQQGLAYSIEVPLAFLNSLPPLPSYSTVDEYVSTFLSRVHPIYPVVDHDMLQESVENLRPKIDQGPQALDSRDYPALACLYSVFSIAADELEGRPTEKGATYLEAAYFLYAHLVASPYVTSVQALLLLTIVLRHRNRDGASLGTLGQAIRIAQSIGLHRHVSAAERIPSNSGVNVAGVAQPTDLYARIWWTAYILERTMELETGRPSAIRDSECDQILPQPMERYQSRDHSFDYFGSLIGLARIQTSIIELYYTSRLQRKTKDILHEMGRLDRNLLDWASTFPEEIRPGRDIFCTVEEFHLATYVSLQYHQTFIALHRPALMSATPWLRSRVNQLCADTPWRSRLRYALCIGAASARGSLKALNDLLLYAKSSRLITANQVLVVTMVLAIYVTRIPTSRMNASDLAIVVTFAEELEQEYLSMGQDVEFARGLNVLRQQLSEHVASTKMQVRQATLTEQPATPIIEREQQQDLSVDCISDMSSLDDLWPAIWTEDLSNFYVNDTNQDTLSAYLLGLPQTTN